MTPSPRRFFAPLAAAAIVAIGLSLPACRAALDVHTMAAPSAHFERYRTVAFSRDPRPLAPQAYETSPRTAQVRDEIARSAAEALLAHGYAIAPLESADLVLRVEAGRREEALSTTHPPLPTGGPATSSGPGQGLAGGEPMEGGSAANFTGELDREDNELVEGAFVIDAFDRRTGKIAWHGSARTDIPPDRIDHAKLRQAVETVMARFPSTR